MSPTSIAAILAGNGPASAASPTMGSHAPITGGKPVDRVAQSIEALARARDIEELERIRRAVHAAGEAVYHWHVQSDQLTWAGDAAGVAGGADPSQLTSGRGFASLLDRENFTSRYEVVMRSSAVDEGEGVPFAIEYQLRPFGSDDERAFWVEDTGRWYAGPDGRPSEVFGVLRRVDDRHRRDQHLRFLGNCDPLTGMMNRGRLAEALGETIAVSLRDGTNFAFLIAAVNNLPVVNDAYGFDIADEVIVAVGRRLRQVVRTGDSIGRYSGSKYGIILANCSEADIEIAAERFLGVARDSVIETERGPVWAMLSIGAIVLPKHAGNANSAMARAEEALAEAKRQPTDSFIVFKPSAERVSVRGLNARCGAEIVSSLREDRFTLAYQPIVSAKSSEVAMHEALLRMICQDGDPVAAVHLIPIAEKLGLVRLIDRTAMGLAVNELMRSPKARISLNVSGITATDPRWFGLLTDILKEHQAVTNRLMIEITETVAISDLNNTVQFIESLREIGCKVAIDDFGAGYTSFRNLKVLNVDMVKIDGSFCERLAENRDNQYFVRSLIDLAQKFNLETVAEWVQLESDAELLREWGIDYLQGNLFGAAKLTLPWHESAPSEQPGVEKPFEGIVLPPERTLPFAAAPETDAVHEADVFRPAEAHPDEESPSTVDVEERIEPTVETVASTEEEAPAGEPEELVEADAVESDSGKDSGARADSEVEISKPAPAPATAPRAPMPAGAAQPDPDQLMPDFSHLRLALAALDQSFRRPAGAEAAPPPHNPTPPDAGVAAAS